MNTPPGHSPWTQRRRSIRTSAGQWLAGRDAIYREHSLLNELIHSLTETQLMAYGITGEIISPTLSTWLEKAFFMTSYPDSRLWCNSVTSLAAHRGASPVAANVAGFLASDSKAYGSYANFRTAETLCELYQQYKSGTAIEDIVKNISKNGRSPNIPGFLRPIAVQDERLTPMRKVTRDLGFTAGPILLFAEALSTVISESYSGGMNASGYIVAFLLDQKFNPAHIYLLCVRCVECGILACYQEHVDEIDNGFLPLQCDDIEYVGPDFRSFPI